MYTEFSKIKKECVPEYSIPQITFFIFKFLVTSDDETLL